MNQTLLLLSFELKRLERMLKLKDVDGMSTLTDLSKTTMPSTLSKIHTPFENRPSIYIPNNDCTDIVGSFCGIDLVLQRRNS